MTNERMIELAKIALANLEQRLADAFAEKAELQKNINVGRLLSLLNDTGEYTKLVEDEYEEMTETSKGEWRIGKLDDKIKYIQLNIDTAKSILEDLQSN